MKYIKSIDWLAEKLEQVRVVDCRFSLTDASYGQSAYDEQHIPGAVFFDLEKDLSSPVEKHGGRHPLPKMPDLIEKLECAGIDQDTVVVAYDDGEGAFASRFWWLLTYLGHQHVYILDGGFKGWEEAGYPVTDAVIKHETAHFIPSIQTEMLAQYEEVKQRSEDKKAVLIDSRAKERYLGLEEPIDRRPGRIPSAVNKEWLAGFENGSWKSKEKQKERFADLKASDEIIVYCGSGVTATPNILALIESGFQHVKLYAGSYSDWVSYEENPVETGE